MHVYRLEAIGSLDGLVAREEAAPAPSAGEVLVRVRASALNFRDLAIILGRSPFPYGPESSPSPMPQAKSRWSAMASPL